MTSSATPVAATAGMGAAGGQGASEQLAALQVTEQNIVELLDTAAEAAQELSKMQEMTPERLHSLSSRYISLCSEIQDSLHKLVGLVGVATPYEHTSYVDRQNLELARQRALIVLTRINCAMQTVNGGLPPAL